MSPIVKQAKILLNFPIRWYFKILSLFNISMISIWCYYPVSNFWHIFFRIIFPFKVCRSSFPAQTLPLKGCYCTYDFKIKDQFKGPDVIWALPQWCVPLFPCVYCASLLGVNKVRRLLIAGIVSPSGIQSWYLSDSMLYLNLRYQCLRPLNHHGWMIP